MAADLGPRHQIHTPMDRAPGQIARQQLQVSVGLTGASGISRTAEEPKAWLLSPDLTRASQSAACNQSACACQDLEINSRWPVWTGYLLSKTTCSGSDATSKRRSHGLNGLGLGPALPRCLGVSLSKRLNWKRCSGQGNNSVWRGIKAPD